MGFAAAYSLIEYFSITSVRTFNFNSTIFIMYFQSAIAAESKSKKRRKFSAFLRTLSFILNLELFHLAVEQNGNVLVPVRLLLDLCNILTDVQRNL